jgi:hypothetical protein
MLAFNPLPPNSSLPYHDSKYVHVIIYLVLLYHPFFPDPGLPEPNPPANGRCSQLQGDNWYLWNDDCYKLMSEDSVTWDVAEVSCIVSNITASTISLQQIDPWAARL